jgi:hypothetical protein
LEKNRINSVTLRNCQFFRDDRQSFLFFGDFICVYRSSHYFTKVTCTYKNLKIGRDSPPGVTKKYFLPASLLKTRTQTLRPVWRRSSSPLEKVSTLLCVESTKTITLELLFFFGTAIFTVLLLFLFLGSLSCLTTT